MLAFFARFVANRTRAEPGQRRRPRVTLILAWIDETSIQLLTKHQEHPMLLVLDAVAALGEIKRYAV